jgi:hypothetical protein
MEHKYVFYIIIIAGVICAAILVFCLVRYLNRQRTKALKLTAESLSFTFSEKGGQPLIDTFSGFNLFSLGYGRRISNVLAGKFNLIPVTVLDYRYTTGGGKSTKTWHQTLLIIESDKLQLPRFVLQPENIFDKIAGVFGKKDINFETAPVFSKRYQLRGDDEASIRSLFNAPVLDFYERHLGLTTEGDGVRLIYYRFGKKVAPEKIQAFIQEGGDVFNLFRRR